MSRKIQAQYALIGDKLDLLENVEIHLDSQHRILSIDETNFDISDKKVILPGFYNAHVHSADFGLRNNLPKGASLEQLVGGSGIKTKYLQSLSPADLITNVKNSLQEAFSNGINRLNDFREGGLDGVKVYQSPEVQNLINSTQMHITILSRPRNLTEAETLSKFTGLGIRDSYYYQGEELIEIAKTFRNRPIQLHAGEDEELTHRFKNEFGESEVEFFEREVGPDLYVHTNYFSLSDYELLMKNGKGIALCLSSNLRTNRQLPKLKILRDIGFPIECISMGSDNAMFSPVGLSKEIKLFKELSEYSEREILQIALLGGDSFISRKDFSLAVGNILSSNPISLKSSDQTIYTAIINSFPL